MTKWHDLRNPHKVRVIEREVAISTKRSNLIEKNPADREIDHYWRRKSLDEMSGEEWEALCDGCGQCCLNKVTDEDSDITYKTNVACHLLDSDSCRCRDYSHRHERVPDCLPLNAEAIRRFDWLPDSCAYRLIDEGRALYWWHPLLSGDPQTVHDAGISVRGRTLCESQIAPDELINYIVFEPDRET